MKADYSFLSAKNDPIIFTALCIKNHFFKNPALPLKESDLQDYLVDGTGDGGVDAMFSDPSSESSDLVLCQSKFYQTITSDDVYNAMVKFLSKLPCQRVRSPGLRNWHALSIRPQAKKKRTPSLKKSFIFCPLVTLIMRPRNSLFGGTFQNE